MLAVCTVLCYAWDNELTPIFSKQTFLDAINGELNYEKIFCVLPQYEQTKQKHFLHLDPNSNPFPFPYNNGDICLCPTTHSFSFLKYKEKIREIFEPDEKILKELYVKYSDIINHPKTVAVHVRTYHPDKAPHHLFLGEDYFVKAMKHFSDDHLFIIFSDRIEWCKKHLFDKATNMIFMEDNDAIIDFYLMTLCKNIIISNSIFSYMAAILKKNEKGLVFAPNRSLTNGEQIPLEVYPDAWKILSIEHYINTNREILQYESNSLLEKN